MAIFILDFTNHQKRQLLDFLKKYPYIINVKNCLGCEPQKFALARVKAKVSVP